MNADKRSARKICSVCGVEKALRCFYTCGAKCKVCKRAAVNAARDPAVERVKYQAYMAVPENKARKLAGVRRYAKSPEGKAVRLESQRIWQLMNPEKMRAAWNRNNHKRRGMLEART